VVIRGFGSFVVKERKERQGRNPRTRAAITIPAKRDASFRPSKELTEKLAECDRVAQGDRVPKPGEARMMLAAKSVSAANVVNVGGAIWLR